MEVLQGEWHDENKPCSYIVEGKQCRKLADGKPPETYYLQYWRGRLWWTRVGQEKFASCFIQTCSADEVSWRHKGKKQGFKWRHSQVDNISSNIVALSRLTGLTTTEWRRVEALSGAFYKEQLENEEQ